MSSKHNEYIQQRLKRPLVLSVLAAIAVYGASVVLGDLDKVRASISRLSAADWSLILGLSLLNYGLRFFRWEIYFRRLGARIPISLNLAYYLGGFLFTTTPAKAGEALRSLYLRRHGVAIPKSLAAFFAERFIDLVAIVILSLGVAFAFPGFRWLVVGTVVVILTLLPFVRAQSFHDFVARQFGRLHSEQLRTLAERVVEMLQASSILLRSGLLYTGIVLALLAWGAEGLAFYIILDRLDVNVSLALAVGFYSVSVLTGALSFIPGGLGTTEATMVLLLTLVGADYPTALTATLVCRIATLWFAVAIGGFVISALELRETKFEKESVLDNQSND